MKTPPLHPTPDMPAPITRRTPTGTQQSHFERLLDRAPHDGRAAPERQGHLPTGKANTRRDGARAESSHDARQPQPMREPPVSPRKATDQPDTRPLGDEKKAQDEPRQPMPELPANSRKADGKPGTRAGDDDKKAQDEASQPLRQPLVTEQPQAGTPPLAPTDVVQPTVGQGPATPHSPRDQVNARPRQAPSGRTNETTVKTERPVALEPAHEHGEAMAKVIASVSPEHKPQAEPSPLRHAPRLPPLRRESRQVTVAPEGPAPTGEKRPPANTAPAPRDMDHGAASDKAPARRHDQEQPLTSPTPIQPWPAPPGDRVLHSMAAQSTSPALAQDLQALVERLQLQLQTGKTHTGDTALLRAQLPHLGTVEVRLTHAGHTLQVEIHASPGSLQQLQTARGELLERLQRLDPSQPLSLSFANDSGGDQRSRNQRHVHDEWQPEQ
ncbi:type III secretion system needle length determinant [Pseudomonas sp. MWU13-3659]|uniref:type III secretion system needle length determinant n=1 Tax=Pseudomonas sp. MWU13-3659 TaxID=2986964 RepID=UPI002074C012|nr:type III secretion system needle length determinant [Pseudomonas sp. MWU13-3659]